MAKATADEIIEAIGEDATPSPSDSEGSEYKASPYQARIVGIKRKRPQHGRAWPMPKRITRLTRVDSIRSLSAKDSVIGSDQIQETDSDGDSSAILEQLDPEDDFGTNDKDASFNPRDFSATSPIIMCFLGVSSILSPLRLSTSFKLTVRLVSLKS